MRDGLKVMELAPLRLMDEEGDKYLIDSATLDLSWPAGTRPRLRSRLRTATREDDRQNLASTSRTP